VPLVAVTVTVEVPAGVPGSLLRPPAPLPPPGARQGMDVAFEHDPPAFIERLIDAGCYIPLLRGGQGRRDKRGHNKKYERDDTASLTKGNRSHALLLKHVGRPGRPLPGQLETGDEFPLVANSNPPRQPASRGGTS